MKTFDILTSPWAIEPAKLLEIKAIHATHMRGEQIDIAAVEKRLGRPLDNQPKSYDVQDGVAVVCLDGVIAKRMNMFSQISGGTSAELAGRQIQDACADPAVHSIILSIDSPGGTVDGTQTLADIVGACSKPIVSLASGAMCSAAYWIGSAANAVYIADTTTQVGSIGVVATHTDVSGQQAAQGVKTTEIYAGAYKRIASSYAPLSKEGKQSMQDSVDYTYGLFVDAVAKNRKCTADVVLKKMADGRVFIGQQAIDAGLVDGISTMDALISKLNANKGMGIAAMAQKKPVAMTRAELDQAAKAMVKANPSMSYVAAVTKLDAENIPATASPKRQIAEIPHAELDQAAKAMVKANPSMSYLAAVTKIVSAHHQINVSSDALAVLSRPKYF